MALLLHRLLFPDKSWAEDLVVPARVQAELIGKLASYDRNFRERAGSRALVAIVVKPSNVDSSRAAAQIQGAIKDLGLIGGLPHEEVVVPWTNANDFAALCAKERFAIAYFAPDLTGEMAAIAKELTGKNLLTITSVLADVGRGAVLGFELVSGRTKLVINLAQAKRQNVMFRADVLKLMRIVE